MVYTREARKGERTFKGDLSTWSVREVSIMCSLTVPGRAGDRDFGTQYTNGLGGPLSRVASYKYIVQGTSSAQGPVQASPLVPLCCQPWSLVQHAPFTCPFHFSLLPLGENCSILTFSLSHDVSPAPSVYLAFALSSQEDSVLAFIAFSSHPHAPGLATFLCLVLSVDWTCMS